MSGHLLLKLTRCLVEPVELAVNIREESQLSAGLRWGWTVNPSILLPFRS